MQKKPNTKTNSTLNEGGAKSTRGRVNNKAKSRNSNKAVTNDPNWYAVDASLLNDAARIPFSYPTGLPIPTSASNPVGDNTALSIPGIMTLRTVPTIGWSEKDSDPVNIAATQLYAFVRHCNSGSVNYDSGDLMLYLLGMADVYSALEWMRRAYGVAQLYSQSNRYLPKSLLRMMGVDPESMTNNMANFRYKFNILVNKAASFAVPATMSIFPRRAFLYQGVYTEGTSPKDQLYMYIPDGFYVYDWKGSKLEYMRITPNDVRSVLGITLTGYDAGYDAMELLEVVNAMIDVIISNEDMGTMNGDIIKAYGDNTIKLNHLSEDYFVAPAFDAYVLEQMQNATTFGYMVGSNDITSDYVVDDSGKKTGTSILRHLPSVMCPSFQASDGTENLVSQFNDAARAMRALGKQIIVTSLPNPEPKDVMEITRLTSVLEPMENHPDKYILRSGTEYVFEVCILTAPYSYNTDLKYQMLHTASINNFGEMYDDFSELVLGESDELTITRFFEASEEARKMEIAASAFRYAPTIFVYDAGLMRDKMLPTTLDQNLTILWLNKDVNASLVSGKLANFAVVTPWDVSKLHQTAILSEFATPHVSIKPAK